MSCAPAELFAAVESIRPFAGLVSGMPALAVTSGMFLKAARSRGGDEVLPPPALMLNVPQILLALTMMPASGGPPLLANRTAYSPSQSPDQSS